MRNLSVDDFALMDELAHLPSLSALARVRNVPVSAVSRALSRIEAACGARLVRRTTHSLSWTDEGQAFLAHARRILDEQQLLADRLAAGAAGLRGTVRISVSQLLATYVIAAALPGWNRRHPSLHIDLQLEDRMIDIAGERADIAVRAGVPPRLSQRVRSLGRHRRSLYASPDYVARNGLPEAPEDLQHHAVIANSVVASHNDWPFLTAGGERFTRTFAPAVSVNSSAAVVSLAVAGVGIARINAVIGERLCAQGLLVPVLARSMSPETYPVYAVVLAQRQQATRVRGVLDLLQGAFADFRQA